MRPARLLVVFLCGACARDPRDFDCPDIAAGELVVSEVRGDQTGTSDPLGQWIELYNASSRRLELGGVVVKLRKIDGSASARVVVRVRSVAVDAGSYVVLGKFAQTSLPAYVDYGFAGDIVDNIYSAAAVEVESCGTLIDRAIYRDLPGEGTWGFDGDLVPDATANDDEAAWCVDAEGAGAPGTPRERNRPCLP